MSEATVWGLDIGGTKCALVIGDRTGKVLARWQVATADYGADWQRLINDLLKNAEGIYTRPLAVGVSCGGPLSSARGVIMSPPNLPGWDDVHIVEWLQNRLSVPAFLQNDANACALAEWQFGAGRGCKNMVFLTFGTGMGAGLILDGRLYAGTNDRAQRDQAGSAVAFQRRVRDSSGGTGRFDRRYCRAQHRVERLKRRTLTRRSKKRQCAEQYFLRRRGR